MRRVLNVGCAGHPIPLWFKDDHETRLDIDPNCKPDIVASMTNMGDIGTFDVVLCSHALEHLYPHEVAPALNEFMRVLVPGGHAVIIVPDLEGIKATNDPLYLTDDGPVTGLDLIYGLGHTIRNSVHWAHHTGFVDRTLEAAMKAAGFAEITVKRLPNYNLMAVARKTNPQETS